MNLSISDFFFCRGHCMDYILLYHNKSWLECLRYFCDISLLLGMLLLIVLDNIFLLIMELCVLTFCILFNGILTIKPLGYLNLLIGAKESEISIFVTKTGLYVFLEKNKEFFESFQQNDFPTKSAYRSSSFIFLLLF